MGRLRRWRYGYQAVAFVLFIPAMTYYVILEKLPKIILVFVIPIYLLLAWSAYRVYKHFRNVDAARR